MCPDGHLADGSSLINLPIYPCNLALQFSVSINHEISYYQSYFRNQLKVHGYDASIISLSHGLVLTVVFLLRKGCHSDTKLVDSGLPSTYNNKRNK